MLGLVSLVAAGGAIAGTATPDFAPGGPVALGRVIDGTTIALADGRVLRLASIDMPGSPAFARETLARLVSGKALELRYAGARTDRRDRVVAELFADGQWVEDELVRRGSARVHGTVDERLGLDALLADEDAARTDRRGLWARAQFAVRDAASAARDAGTWQIVAGTVAAVFREEGGAAIIFGPDRAHDFRVSLGHDAFQLCRAAGLDPLSLAGARLRVRGFIDGTNRPTMEVTFPEQIERL
ncbi:MAG TPA: thermonuclease family protein [Stellaceae bacterium]|nr:thermonuclease family protein [Stellaceae bacterium]